MLRIAPFLLLFALATPARAQLPDSLSDQTRLSLLTILPGEALYSAFGHSALRVYDPATGFDAVFNYGTFDFRDPMFIPKFVYGKLDYFLSVVPARATLQSSRREQRPVIEQELALTPTQTAAVYRALRINALPENRAYRYDFLFDNCSTRPRDVLAATLGPAIRFAPEPDPGLSFRRLLDPYIIDRPWLDLGFDLLLGTPTDRIASPYEVMFLPEYLMEAFDHAVLVEGEATRPLVARKDTVLAIPGYTRPVPSAPWPLLLFTGLFVGGLLLTARQARTSRPSLRIDVLLFATIGLVGFFLLFMWLGTEHQVTRWNANLLWAWPTHLVAAVLLWRGRTRSLGPYFRITFATGLVLLVALLLDWPQDFHPATVPLLALVVLRSGWLGLRLLRPAPIAPSPG